ncbi:hypothetical protein BT96DRAFT_946361 [Gymnopus androsaceus JB14]|uniref:Uncharacterized protein n=1 Tax=Gymnopus androsaceus JB14 TaxID=1447944 RepID=A0A6A4GYN1_9AGAR|nr:hypothetical protein BT96DRAFT_946361 [Gymnopus androsaceus JB14]
MRFSTLSLLVTAASAAFSFAAPLTTASSALEARGQCYDIQCIISGVTTSLTPLIEELSQLARGLLAYITTENCTVADLTPIVYDIKVVLTGAIKDVESLTGVALITVLTTVEGVVLTVSDVAQLVFGLLTLIFGGLSAVLKVAYNLDANVIIPLLAEVAELVATLLQLILQLVDGLLACLLPFLGSILTIIISLGISDEYSFLNISVSSVVATATGYAS